MMNTLLAYLLESTICLAIFYLFYIVVLRSQPSYQYNRFYLLGTSLLSFIFPLLEIPVSIPGRTQGMATSYEGYLLMEAAEVGQVSTTSQAAVWPLVLLIIYLAGVCLALFLFLQQLYRLYQIIRESQHISQGDYQLIYTHGRLPASSFFHYLFWDNTCTLKAHEQQQILAHEEIHIQQKHSYDVLYMSLLRIIFWFNPLVYLYDKALTETHEFAADEGVLKRIPPKEYARLLTRRLFEGLDMSLVNHFYKSRTLKRIKMMETINNKTPWYKLALAAPLAAIMFFTFSCQQDEETMAREAVAESYEEVHAEIDKVKAQMGAIRDKYYPNRQDYINAVNAVIAKSGQPVALPWKLALQDVASDADMKKMKALSIRSKDLQEKLMRLPDPDGIYSVVENQPEPASGMKAFYDYIGKNIRYPQEARSEGVEGKVFVQFTVNEYGELANFKALKGIGGGCDEEAIRVLENAPEWRPGTTDGKPVKVKMVMPITFKLDGASSKASHSDTGKPAASDGESLSETVVVGYR